MQNKEYIILVDEQDNKIGIEEKLKVHQKGLLHRAFSIFVFNSKGDILIQKRADLKYHSAGLWSNTCDGHPKQKEKLSKATHRRLKEEMGFDCKLKKLYSFHYQAVLNNDLIENEIDYIFVGKYDGKISINKNEVSDYKWISLQKLKKDIFNNPNKYTIWFKKITTTQSQPIFKINKNSHTDYRLKHVS